MERTRNQIRRFMPALVVLSLAPLLPPRAWAALPLQPEHPSSDYDSILYADIGPRLRQIEASSFRVRVQVAGSSAGGRDLYLVVVAAPEVLAQLDHYRGLRREMLEDPGAFDLTDPDSESFPVPVFVNAGTRGLDYAGVDAALRLIEALAYGDDGLTATILDNLILIVNVVQNPDGRVMGTSRNGAGFDLARDIIAQSQPETRAMVAALAEWSPIVALDLRGRVSPMRIEPSLLPGGAGHDFDLFAKWALLGAQAMQDEVFVQTGQNAQIPLPGSAGGTLDWPPISLANVAQYHGAYGYELSAPCHGERGVAALDAAASGMLEFVAGNREAMLRDQAELFQRGLLGAPQLSVSDDLLSGPSYELHHDWTRVAHPAAYVIPAQAALQKSPHGAQRLVDLLGTNGIAVHQAVDPFQLSGVSYPRGTYIVRLEQPKRGLIDAFLWAGRGGTFDPGRSLYDLAGWSLPLLWGVSVTAIPNPVDVATEPVAASQRPLGSVSGAGVAGFAIPATNNAAYRAANHLLDKDAAVQRSAAPFADSGRVFGAGTLILPHEGGSTPVPKRVAELAQRYGLHLYGLEQLPPDPVPVRSARIAVVADEGVRSALGELGFHADRISAADLDAGVLARYDVLVNDQLRWEDLYPAGRASFISFLEEGGGYIGIGPAGIALAASGDLLDFEYESADSGYYGILKLDCEVESAETTAPQPAAECFGFARQPIWFSSRTGLSTVSASLVSNNFFVSGHWPAWESSGAGGKPVVLHGRHGDGLVTLFGINPTYQAYPRSTFRLLADAIYASSE